MKDDDLFEDDETADEAYLYDTDRGALLAILQEFAEAHDMPAYALHLLLLDLTVTFRVIGYFEETEKPSAGGLRLEYDRLRRDCEDFLRAAKKEAPERIKLFHDLAATLAAEDGNDSSGQ